MKRTTDDISRGGGGGLYSIRYELDLINSSWDHLIGTQLLLQSIHFNSPEDSQQIRVLYCPPLQLYPSRVDLQRKRNLPKLMNSFLFCSVRVALVARRDPDNYATALVPVGILSYDHDDEEEMAESVTRDERVGRSRRDGMESGSIEAAADMAPTIHEMQAGPANDIISPF